MSTTAEHLTTPHPPDYTILIVDDHPTNLGVIFDSLKDRGFKTLVATDGELALQRAEYAHPDLILLDIVMPGIDGFEVCRRLKADEVTQDIPVIFMTALTGEKDKVKGFEVGGKDYVTKPIQPGELLARVATHLRIRELTRNLEEHAEKLEETNRALKHSHDHLQQEISDRKRAEEEIKKHASLLEAANKELESFSYSVSHDLRAPLRAIVGFSHVLLEDYSDKLDAEGQRVLDIICRNTQKMGRLIDDLLKFSRLGRQAMNFAEIDMEALTHDVVQELETLTPNRQLQFKIETLPSAYGNGASLRQVLINLLSNAIKFTASRDTAVIEIGCQVEANEKIYCVKDNGVGFDMTYVDKLFGVFQRLHSAEEFEGTGIGLALVQRIIHRHGGRVWAEGEVNTGAAFYFALPGKGEENDGHPTN